MGFIKSLCLIGALLLPLPVHAGKITIAAVADLKFAMDEIVAAFKNSNPADEVEVIYGSSGKFHTQNQQGASYDLYFSADIAFPRELVKKGLAATDVNPYAFGRIVLWSASLEATRMTLDSLADPKITRIAIANPRHAPYGKRAEEALRASGLWEKVEPKLVYGENIAHTAQFVQTGNAQVGVIALFGHSGSGKTTLLRCIAGLERAPDGFLALNGEIWQDGKRHWLPTYNCILFV